MAHWQQQIEVSDKQAIDGKAILEKPSDDAITVSIPSPTIINEDHDLVLRFWDNPRNPQNPLNWNSRRKWTNVFLVSAQAMLSAICSTIPAAGSANIAREFHLTSTYTPTLPVGMYVLGLALGPLCLGPLSEIYGRRNVYLISFSLFTLFNIGCATSPNITALSILRLASGACGSAGPTLGAASIGDMFLKKDRGKAQAVYALGPTLGPVIGPLIGSFVVDRTHGWRWLVWILAIASGVVVLCSAFLLRETYAPFLLRKNPALSNDTTEHEKNTESSLTAATIFRPFRLLLFSPICTIISLYMALVFGIIYLHLVTIPLLYGPEPLHGLFSYRWRHGLTGLAYLPAGLGILTGTVICALYLNKSYAYMAARQQQQRRLKTNTNINTKDDEEEEVRPENRLVFLQLGMIIVPCGLVVFAWTAEYHLHWAIPLVGAAVFATGMLMAFVCVQTYLVDVYGDVAASALAAMIATRSVGSCVFSIVGFQLYVSLGYGWGTTLIVFICVVVLPVPMLLYKYGRRLRGKSSMR